MNELRKADGGIANDWYVAALSSEIGSGRATARTIYGKPYALFRTKDGTVHALEDRCLHRGTKLSEGACDGATLRCPYHGWAYDRRGAVVDIPSEGPSSPDLSTAIAARGWRVASLPLVELDGVVWAWMGQDENGFPSAPSPAEPEWRFPYADDPRWTSYFMVTDFGNEVGHLAQNFMDVPHTVFVHSKWFRDRAMMSVPYHLEVGGGRVKATYRKPGDSIGSVMSRVINPMGLPMEHTDEFIYPNLTRVDYRFGPDHGFVINSQCTPVERWRTRVYTWIAYRGNRLAPLLKPAMRFYTRRVIQQDVEIMANQGSNLVRFSDRSDWKSTAADEILIAITRLREIGKRDPLEARAQAARRTEERKFWI